MDIKDTLRYVSLAAELALVARICATGLARRFPAFVSLRSLNIALAAAFIALPTSSPVYRQTWIWIQPAVMLLAAAAAFEVIARLAEGFASPGRARRQMAGFAGAAGVATAAALVYSDAIHTRWLMPWLQGMFFARRAEAIAIAAALFVANVIFALAAPPTRKNAVWHARVFAVYVIADAVGYFAMSVSSSRPVQIGLQAAQIMCFGAWFVLLSRSGESLAIQPTTRVGEDFETALSRVSD